MPKLRLVVVTLTACISIFGSAPALALTKEELKAKLSTQMVNAGSAGAYAVDLDTGGTLFSWNATTERIPASVQKLYTTATVLLRDGADGALDTAVLGSGELKEDGTYDGSLFLKGAGDPSFSTTEVKTLAADIAANSGIKEITGRIFADESVFDTVRGVPDPNWAVSPWVGSLSGLAFNHGSSPDRSADTLARLLRSKGIDVSRDGRRGTAPSDAQQLAKITSPTFAQLAARTNKPSDNFYAEMLLKGLGARHGSRGSTTTGSEVVRQELAQSSIYPRVVDGSGLSRSNRTAPIHVVRLLEAMHEQPVYAAFKDSLSVAGRDGTLAKRMRKTAAKGRCQAKTGTLSNVSALAGYCDTTGGKTVAFAILMNSTNPYFARKRQDKMTAALAKYDGL